MVEHGYNPRLTRQRREDLYEFESYFEFQTTHTLSQNNSNKNYKKYFKN